MIKTLSIRPTRPLPWIFRGLIGREMLAVAPVLLMLLVMQVFAPFLPMLWKAVGAGAALTLKPESMALSLWIFFLIAAFLAGVLCGAEEDENGTAVIARQLPVSSLRVFLEKVTGAVLALTAWYGLALALDAAILKTLGKSIPGQMTDMHYLNAPLLMFCFALGCAAWMGKVIPAAVSGGILAFSWLMLIAQITDSNALSNTFMRVQEGAGILYLGCALTFAAAAWSFVFRKGDPASIHVAIKERFGIGNPAKRELLKSALVIGFPMVALWTIVASLTDFHPVLGGGLEAIIVVILFVTLGKSFGADPLIRSERTAHKRLIVALSLLVSFSPALGFIVLDHILNTDIQPEPLVGLIGVAGGLCLAVAIRSAMLWSKEEVDTSRGYLFTLPLPMHWILRLKLRALVYHHSVLVAVALLMVVLISLNLDLTQTVKEENYLLGDLREVSNTYRQIELAAYMLLTALPAFALFVVTLKLYFRSVIVTVMLSSLYIPFVLLCVYDLVIQSVEGNAFNVALVFDQGAGWVWLVRQAVLALGLGGWLFWLYSRSAIHERGPVARFFGALLFVATFYETAFLLLFANYRDLLFIIFGI